MNRKYVGIPPCQHANLCPQRQSIMEIQAANSMPIPPMSVAFNANACREYQARALIARCCVTPCEAEFDFIACDILTRTRDGERLSVSHLNQT